MNATVFTLIEFGLFFGFIFLAGLWQLKEIDHDRRKRDAERGANSEGG